MPFNLPGWKRKPTQPSTQPKCGDVPTLKGQVALVTGGNSGIGAGIVQALATAGAKVCVNYVVDAPAAEALAAEAKEAAGAAMTFQADVSDESQVTAMFAAVQETLGTPDILINNAGLQRDATFDELTLEQWNKVIDVNLTGQFLCAREAVRAFKNAGPPPTRQPWERSFVSPAFMTSSRGQAMPTTPPPREGF